MLVLLNNITGVWKLDWRIDTAELTQIPVISDNQLTFIQVYKYIHPGIYFHPGIHLSRFTPFQVYIHPGIHSSWYTSFLVYIHPPIFSSFCPFIQACTFIQVYRVTNKRWDCKYDLKLWTNGNLKVKIMFCLKFILFIAF